MRLAEQVALVTGGGTGIGRATSQALARQGARVAVNYSRSRERAEETVREIRAGGGQAMALQADVAREADARRLIDDVIRAWGRLDVLVNNAGWTRRVPHADLDGLTEEVWQRTLAVNLYGAWHCTRHAIPHMQRQGRGVIVNVTSVAAFHGMGSSMAYCASKAALTSLTRSLARAFGPTIRVNNVAPGLVDTGFADWPPEVLAEGRLAAATGALPTPEDVAEAVVFLAADGRSTTGTTVFVDGGIIPLGPQTYRPSAQAKPE